MAEGWLYSRQGVWTNLAVARTLLVWALLVSRKHGAAPGIVANAAAVSDASPRAPPTAGLQISSDGTCGGTTSLTCAGSAWGQCCSVHGYCGSSDSYCGKGCSLPYGTCSPGQGTSVVDSAPPPQLPSGTQREGPNPACPLCPVCTICMSPTPTPVPSSCRLILTATRWTTATATTTTTVTAKTLASGAKDVADAPGSCVVSTTAGQVIKTVTQTTTQAQIQQTTTVTETQTLTVVNTVIMSGTTGGSSGADGAVPPVAGIVETGTMPSPVFPGIVANCRRWYKTQDGDTCGTVAAAANISKDDLHAWNTRIGSTADDTVLCEQGKPGPLASSSCRVPCGELWAGYYLCVGV